MNKHRRVVETSKGVYMFGLSTIGSRASLFLLLVPTLLATPAAADLFAFYGITNNNPLDVAIGEAQLFVDVTDVGNGQVQFEFKNEGPDASSIACVYFDDRAGVLHDISSIINDTGVSFSAGGSPENLPGGNDVGFVANFWATADPPPAHNGVDPGELLGIVFDLQAGAMFGDVIAQISGGALRIGIHVIDFASGGSESFMVPVPGAFLLGVLGLGYAGMKLRRRCALNPPA